MLVSSSAVLDGEGEIQGIGECPATSGSRPRLGSRPGSAPPAHSGRGAPVRDTERCSPRCNMAITAGGTLRGLSINQTRLLRPGTPERCWTISLRAFIGHLTVDLFPSQIQKIPEIPNGAGETGRELPSVDPAWPPLRQLLRIVGEVVQACAGSRPACTARSGCRSRRESAEAWSSPALIARIGEFGVEEVDQDRGCAVHRLAAAVLTVGDGAGRQGDGFASWTARRERPQSAAACPDPTM